MALEIRRRVLTDYDVDTRKHIAGIKRLEQAEKERASTAEKANKLVSNSLDDFTKKLGGVVAGYATLNFAIKAHKNHVEELRLADAALGVDMAKLRTASAGLKTDLDLLRDAARLNNGMFRMTSDEMATTERAMRVLNQRGFEAQEVNKKVLDAVTALKTDGLKDLGIVVEQTSDKAEMYRRILEKLRETTKGLNDDQLTTAEKAEKAGATISNMIDKLESRFGKLTVALGGLINKLDDLANKHLGGDWFDASVASLGMGQLVGLQGVATDALVRTGSQMSPIQATNANMARVAEVQRQLALGNRGKAWNLGVGGWSVDSDPQVSLGDAEVTPLGRGGGARSAAVAASVRTVQQALAGFARTVALSEQTGRGFFGGGAANMNLGVAAGGQSVFGADVTGALSGAINGRQTANWQAELRNRGAARTSMVESVIGPIEHINLAKTAFDSLTASVTAGYEAMVTGSMSFAKAFKQTIGSSILASGKNMLVLSIQEGAAALASLALGPIGGASALMHAKAAAAYLAGSVAAGGIAAALGAGGGGGSTSGYAGAGAAAPVGGAGGGAAAPYQGSHTTVYVNDSFGEGGARSRIQQTKRRIEEAYGNAAVKNS